MVVKIVPDARALARKPGVRQVHEPFLHVFDVAKGYNMRFVYNWIGFIIGFAP